MRRLLILASVFFTLVISGFGQTANVGKPSGGSAVYATYTVKPEYPYFAQSRHMQGSGIFQLHIRADGTVSSVDTIQSTGYFELDEVSVGAFSKWRFRPPGRRTKVKMPINFSLSHGGFPRPPLPPPPNRGKVREVHEDLTNRLSQPPLCDATSVKLFQHPAVAYLCLVRPNDGLASQLITQLMSTTRSAPGLARQVTNVFMILESLIGPMLLKIVTAATVP